MGNDRLWLLMTRELPGEASAEELLELKTLAEADPELGYCREVFNALWQQDPEADHMAISIAWEKLKGKIEQLL